MQRVKGLAADTRAMRWPGSACAQTHRISLGTLGGPMPSATLAQSAHAPVVRDRVCPIDAGNDVGQRR